MFYDGPRPPGPACHKNPTFPRWTCAGTLAAIAASELTRLDERRQRFSPKQRRRYPDLAEQPRPVMAALNRPDLVVDATGVGVGVVQMLRGQELSTFRVKVDYTPRISRKSAASRKRMSTFRFGPLVTSHEVQCVGQ